MHILQINMLVSDVPIENVVRYLFVILNFYKCGDCHHIFLIYVHNRRKFPGGCHIRRFFAEEMFPGVCILSGLLSLQLRIRDFWALGGQCKFSCADLITFFFRRHSLGRPDIPNFSSTDPVETKLTGHVFARTIGFRFIVGEPSREFVS